MLINFLPAINFFASKEQNHRPPDDSFRARGRVCRDTTIALDARLYLRDEITTQLMVAMRVRPQ